MVKQQTPQIIVKKILLVLGLSLCILVLTYLAARSLFVTYASEVWNPLSETGIRADLFNSGLKIICSAIFSITILVCCFYIFRNKNSINWKRFLGVACFISFIFQLIWVFGQSSNGTYYSDASQLLTYGLSLTDGSEGQYFNQTVPDSFGSLKQGSLYLVNYPYQSGSLLLYCFLAKIAGIRSGLLFQVINILFNEVSIICLTSLTALIAKKEITVAITAAFLNLCFPNLLYSSFMYPNQIGFGLICLYIYLNARGLTAKGCKAEFKYIILSLIPFSLMCWIKSTFVIIGIGTVLIWFIHILGTGLKYGLSRFLLSLLIVCVGSASSFIPQRIMENRIGYDFGSGIPKTAWIAMGLQDSALEGTPKMPGWWNPFPNNIQAKTNNNYAEMAGLSKEAIEDRVNNFVKDPRYCLYFFRTKVDTEWCSPDFDSRYFAAINYSISADGSRVQFIENKTGGRQFTNVSWSVFQFIFPFVDAFQSSIYIAAAAYCVILFKNRSSLSTIEIYLPCLFIVGFFVYLLWEAKAQYCLPFFTLLIPCAALAFEYVCCQFYSNHFFGGSNG